MKSFPRRASSGRRPARPWFRFPAAALLAALGGFAAGPEFAGAQAPILKKVLPNGLTVITQTDASSAITVVEIVIGGGASAEPGGRAGIAHLTARLSVNIPDETTSRDFTVKALKSGMGARDDDAVIHLEFLTEFAEPMLATISKIFNRPIFSDIRMNRLVESMEHQRRIQIDDARYESHLVQRETFFGDSAYAGETLGTEESLRALRVRDARDFYERLFVAGNITIVAVSDLAPDALGALIERHFASLRPGAPPPPPAALVLKDPPYPPRIVIKKQQQSVVSCGFILPSMSRRDYVRISLIENALGRGVGSRLWTLRVDQKLAYNVFAQAFFFRRAGLFEAYLETDAPKTASAREALAEVLRDFQERGLTAEELEAGRAILWSGFLRANETKAARATTLGWYESMGLGADFFAHFRDELYSLTLDEVNAEIRRLMDPARASWVTVGPEQ